MTRRVSQDIAKNWHSRTIGLITIEHCWQCPRYMITLCQETGRKIQEPLSGAIPEDCPLPKTKTDCRGILPQRIMNDPHPRPSQIERPSPPAPLPTVGEGKRERGLHFGGKKGEGALLSAKARTAGKR